MNNSSIKFVLLFSRIWEFSNCLSHPTLSLTFPSYDVLIRCIEHSSRLVTIQIYWNNNMLPHNHFPQITHISWSYHFICLCLSIVFGRIHSSVQCDKWNEWLLSWFIPRTVNMYTWMKWGGKNSINNCVRHIFFARSLFRSGFTMQVLDRGR